MGKGRPLSCCVLPPPLHAEMPRKVTGQTWRTWVSPAPSWGNLCKEEDGGRGGGRHYELSVPESGTAYDTTVWEKQYWWALEVFLMEFLVKCLIHVPSMESLLNGFLQHLYHLESQKETDGALTLGNSGSFMKRLQWRGQREETTRNSAQGWERHRERVTPSSGGDWRK